MKRVAVIDIGSNSVRLVVYGITGSALISLYDEKATCGLGRNLWATGKLDPEGKERAITELRRFAELAADFNLSGFFPFATAAVRDASDGQAFIERVLVETGLEVQVVSGLDEARFAAMGVAGAIPGATGVVGDLGGGSLELVRLENGVVRDQATLPIGALMRPEDASANEMKKWIASRLAAVDWLGSEQGGDFYLVGGAWRAFARAHMRQNDHPVSVIHEYAIETDDALELAELIGMMSERSVTLLSSVSRRRRSIMPYAALTLARIAQVARPDRVVASAHGAREGYVRDAMGMTGGDPLLDYSRYAGAATARIPPDGEKVLAWLSPLFAGLDHEAARWVEAACWLSDLAGRDHPDRRADIALARGSNLPSVAFSHAARAFIGTALMVRYSGPKKRSAGDAVLSELLLTEEQTAMAFRLGTALRLGHAISPSGRALDKTPLVVSPDRIALDGPAGLLSGDTVGRRFASLAAEFQRAPVLLGAKAAA